MNEKYYNLELSIISCLLQKSELMEKVKLKDEHFIKYKSLWLFMKSFYKKFGTFDLELMMSVSNNKYKFLDYINVLIEREPAPSLFEKYQNILIEAYNEEKQDKHRRTKIFELANDLYNKNINFEDFKKQIKEFIL